MRTWDANKLFRLCYSEALIGVFAWIKILKARFLVVEFLEDSSFQLVCSLTLRLFLVHYVFVLMLVADLWKSLDQSSFWVYLALRIFSFSLHRLLESCIAVAVFRNMLKNRRRNYFEKNMSEDCFNGEWRASMLNLPWRSVLRELQI